MIERLRPEFVHYMPDVLEEGILYFSQEFELAIHLCPCGCQEKVVTPIGPGEWTLTLAEEGPSLSPSMGNRFACKSHYWLDKGQIRWA